MLLFRPYPGLSYKVLSSPASVAAASASKKSPLNVYAKVPTFNTNSGINYLNISVICACFYCTLWDKCNCNIRF